MTKRAKRAAILGAVGITLTSAALLAEPPGLRDAIAAQEAANAERPGNAATLNDLGNLLVLAQQFDRAEAAYQEALTADADATFALYNLALLYEEQGRLREARRLHQRSIEVDPEFAWGYYGLGRVFAAKNQRPKAVGFFATAFRIDPRLGRREDNPDLLFNQLASWAITRALLDPPPGELTRSYTAPEQLGERLYPSAGRRQVTAATDSMDQP